MVEPPSEEETTAVKEASEPQADVIEDSGKNEPETVKVESSVPDQPLQEATVDTPSDDVEMKESTEEAPVASSEDATTTSTDAKPEEGAEKTEEKEPEIP